jgi:NAD(P)-dependent dehydrogenase (short-subunit alcohol dehydrogenase family)
LINLSGIDSPQALPADSVVLVTGATQGLGRHVALALARPGATLLLHGRDASRLEDVAADVAAAAPDVAVRTYLADFADLVAVRSLAAQVLAGERRLDVLVNNAAVGGGVDPSLREVSRQGYELRLAVNHLAPYLLTRELLPLLEASAPARVVNVASIGQAPVDFDDVMLERSYEGIHAYCRSKLAMIAATFAQADELAARGISINAIHPAHLMETQMVRQSGFVPATSIEDGVRPTIRLVVDPTLASVTGRYFDRFDDRPAHPQAHDPAARTRLMALTRDLTGT